MNYQSKDDGSGSLVLQKYMDTHKFLSLVQGKKLFMSKMSGFKDNLEGGLTASDFFECTNDASIFDVAMNCRGAEASKLIEEINGRTFETIFGPQLKNDAVDFFYNAREWIYVSCWYKSNEECPAMWDLYGGKNSVCIFTTEEKLRKVTLANQDINNLVFEDVKYIGHKKDKHQGTLSPFKSKATPYCFEKEFRSIAWNDGAAPLSRKTNNLPGITSDEINLNDFIDRVVISPFSDSWYAESIKSICAQYGVNVQVTESTLKTGRIDDLYNAMDSLEELIALEDRRQRPA
ncbi:hypothetical protein ACF8LD_12880 [Pseudomonas sp. zbq_5]|uniref:hypothetical protein n=1 Tax=unclassified Pseudomonas TaxID=196821 RepID=UPI00370B8894